MPTSFALEPLWFDGFDMCGIIGGGPTFYHESSAANWGGPPVGQVIAGRYSGLGVRGFFGNTSSFQPDLVYSMAMLDGGQGNDSVDFVRCQADIRISNAYPTSKQMIFWADVFGTERFRVSLDQFGILTIDRFGTNYGTALLPIPLDTWMTIGIEARFIYGGGGIKEASVWINDTLYAYGSGISQPFGDGGVALGHWVFPTNCGTGAMDLDNWIVWKPTTSTGHTGGFAPLLRVQNLWFNGTVQEQWGSSPAVPPLTTHTLINSPAPTGDIRSSTAGQENIYELDDLTDVPATILGVLPSFAPGFTGAGDIKMQVGINTAGAGYMNGNFIHTLAPDGLAWDKSKIDALRYRIIGNTNIFKRLLLGYVQVLRSNEVVQNRRRVVMFGVENFA